MLNPVHQQGDALDYSSTRDRRTSFKWIFLIMSLHKSQGHKLKSQTGKEACGRGSVIPGEQAACHRVS